MFVFGGKAVRTRSYLMAMPWGTPEGEKLDADIIRYFATEDKGERDALGEEIHAYFRENYGRAKLGLS